TNVLFFDRSGPTNETWYYEHQLPEGRRSYTKTRALEFDEFAPLIEWWNQRTETETAWRVPVSAVRDRGWNLDFRNPNRPAGLADAPPLELLSEATQIGNRINGFLG